MNEGEVALLNAAKAGDLETIQKLVADGVDVNCEVSHRIRERI